MNAIWNLSVLERPPCIMWQISPLDAKKRGPSQMLKRYQDVMNLKHTEDKYKKIGEEFFVFIFGMDIKRFKTTLTTAIHDLESMGDLHINAAALSRLIYRMKSKFRNDKGLKYMTKLNKALLNYYNMSLKKEYVTLQSDFQMEDGMCILPSKQSLEYVLVRTQGFGKLMARIEEISRYTSHFLRARIQLGHAWNVALVAYAVTSRIWFHVRNVIRKCCKWYDELYQCAEQFQYVGVKPWLPTDQSLPRNLKSWLCLEWLDVDMINNRKSQTWQRIFEELPTEVHNDTKTSTTPNDETDDSRLTQIEIASISNVLEDKSMSNNDIGEVIDREVFKRSRPLNDRSVTMKRKHTDINERRSLKEPKIKRKKNNRK